MKEAKITICLITYQRYVEIRQAIDSIINQKFQDWHLMVWNDGPDEKKRDIVQGYKDKRILYCENGQRTNLYGSDMRNHCIGMTNTEWIFHMNDDNILSPIFLSETIGQEDASQFDCIKITVAMQDFMKHFWPDITEHEIQNREFEAIQMMNREITDKHQYLPFIYCLRNDLNEKNRVDAMSYVLKTKIMKEIGGWHYQDSKPGVKTTDDYATWEKMLNRKDLKIKYIDKVLALHR